MSTYILNPPARFAADGFYVHTAPPLPRDLIDRAVVGMDEVRAGRYDTGVAPEGSYWKPGDDPQKLGKIEMPQIASGAIWELLTHPALGELAGQITGAAWVQIWWVQLLYKPSTPPGGTLSTNVGWHHDRHYWQVWEEGSELFTAWVALSDVTADAGPMRFLRGSHRWGLQASDFYGQDHHAQRTAIRVPEGERWEEVPALLPPGGVSFHHHLTYHASGPNLSALPRRSFALHMRTQNSRPVGDTRDGLARHIDNPRVCPIIYRRASG